jgi:hypothetical protein
MKRTKETYTNARLDDINAKLLTLLHTIESQSYAIDYLINKCNNSNVYSPKSTPSPKKHNRKHHTYNSPRGKQTFRKKNTSSHPQQYRRNSSGSCKICNLWSSSDDNDSPPTYTYAYKADDPCLQSPGFPHTQVTSSKFPPVHTAIKKFENFKTSKS